MNIRMENRSSFYLQINQMFLCCRYLVNSLRRKEFYYNESLKEELSLISAGIYANLYSRKFTSSCKIILHKRLPQDVAIFPQNPFELGNSNADGKKPRGKEKIL